MNGTCLSPGRRCLAPDVFFQSGSSSPSRFSLSSSRSASPSCARCPRLSPSLCMSPLSYSTCVTGTLDFCIPRVSALSTLLRSCLTSSRIHFLHIGLRVVLFFYRVGVFCSHNNYYTSAGHGRVFPPLLLIPIKSCII